MNFSTFYRKPIKSFLIQEASPIEHNTCLLSDQNIKEIRVFYEKYGKLSVHQIILNLREEKDFSKYLHLKAIYDPITSTTYTLEEIMKVLF